MLSKMPEDKLGGCGVKGRKDATGQERDAWKLALEMQGTNAGRRQKANTMIHCSPIIKHHRLRNL